MEDWDDPHEYIRIIHSIFPNLSVSGIVGGHCLVSQVSPGKGPETTTTRQSILCAKGGKDEAWHLAAKQFSEMTLQAVRDEDYSVVATIQHALNSGANNSFLIGRNEPGVQHYHRAVAAAMDGTLSGLNAVSEG